MIQCIINGHVAIPAMKEDVRLVRENPYVKAKDSYTYDITFPLDIPENRRVFGPLNRLDTSKRNRKFDDCLLTVGNVTVIHGVGTVTSITATELKLQILGGGSSLRYRADFDQVFIDRITYPTVPDRFRNNVTKRWGPAENLIDVDSDVRNRACIGDVGTAVFMPVWDNTNQCVANELWALRTSETPSDWPQEQQIAYCLFHRAVQPNLMMVLNTVLSHMGYTVGTNDYDTAPWNELVICSARQTAIIAKALPHWTVSKFLDEFRKLFNAVFLFDNSARTVSIKRADQFDAGNVVAYEAADEFQSNYDEDGLEYLGSSNIRYNLSGLGSQMLEVPDEVIENFTIQEYDSYGELSTAFRAMAEQQKLTTLMVEPGGYHYGAEQRDSTGAKTGEIVLRSFGQFTKMIRDSTSGNEVSLDICPVAVDRMDFKFNAALLNNGNYHRFDDLQVNAWLPIVENSELLPEQDSTQGNDEDERPYVTIEEVVESGESATREEDGEETRMELMWVGGVNDHPWNGTNRLPLRIPTVFADWRVCSIDVTKRQSLALSHAGTYPHIGQLHGNALRINSGGSIDGNDEICIPFLCDGIPDPSAVYVFHGKRYLCSKVELKVTQDGIDPLKQGYFYEITS